MSFKDEIISGWKKMVILSILYGILGAAAGAVLDKFVPIDNLAFRYGSIMAMILVMAFLYAKGESRWLRIKAAKRGRTRPCWGCVKFDGGNRNYIRQCRRCARRTQIILVALVIGIVVSAIVRQIAAAIISNTILVVVIGLTFGFAAGAFFVLKVRLTK